MLAPGVFEIVCPATRPSHLVLHVPLARDDNAGCVGLLLDFLHRAVFGLNHEHFEAPAAGRRARASGAGSARGHGFGGRGWLLFSFILI
jgi:hypothetical protein